MENIDLVEINFNEEQLFILNACLGFLMFGIALDMKVDDFREVFRRPKLPLIGITSQLVLLPILNLILVLLFQPPPSVALGMILVSACPGGNVSNYAVHLSKGNSALSVMMTAITTIAAIIITPISFIFWSKFYPSTSDLVQKIELVPMEMIQLMFVIILIPLVLGMWLNHFYPQFVQKISKWIQRLSMGLFLSFVVGAIASNYENLVNYVGLVFWIVLIYNSLALLMGYYWAKLNKLSHYNAKAIAIETGIQNTGLALVVIFNFFDGLGGMALIAAWWGIWHMVSAFSVAVFWRNRA